MSSIEEADLNLAERSKENADVFYLSNLSKKDDVPKYNSNDPDAPITIGGSKNKTALRVYKINGSKYNSKKH